MNAKIVTIYKRKDGQIYLHGHKKSSMGINLASPPFFRIAPSDIEQLPRSIKELLGIEQETVHHPKTFNQLDPLYAIAECRDWNEFAKGTLCFHIALENGKIELTRTKKDGAGFADLPHPVELGKVAELESILKTIPELT